MTHVYRGNVPVPPRQFSGSHFRDADENWPLNPDADPAAVAAAWLQYKAAQKVWSAIASGSLTVERVGAAFGESGENQRRKLAGDAPAYASDLAGWVILCGPDGLQDVVGTQTDLFPPTYIQAIGDWRPGNFTFPVFRSPVQTADPTAVIEHVQNSLDPLLDLGIANHVTEDVLAFHVAMAFRTMGVEVSRIHRDLGPDGVLRVVCRTPPELVVVRPRIVILAGTESLAQAADMKAEIRLAISSAARDEIESSWVLVLANAAGDSILGDALGDLRGGPGMISLGPFEPTEPDGDKWWAGNTVDIAVMNRPTRSQVDLWAISVSKPHTV